MLDPTYIETLVNRFMKAMPQDMLQAKTDVEKHLKAGLSATFSKMDLVSREEFDIQSLLLQRTREKLEDLQKQTDTLRETLNNTSA